MYGFRKFSDLTLRSVDFRRVLWNVRTKYSASVMLGTLQKRCRCRSMTAIGTDYLTILVSKNCNQSITADL